MQANAYTIAFDWDLVLEKIRDDQCLLVLGPEVFCAPESRPYQELLFEFLNKPENKHHSRHYPGEDFFFFDESHKRTHACHAIKKFYKDVSPPAHLRLLAEVPFHVALTVTPDKLLNFAFDEAGFAYQAGFYKKNKDPQVIKPPSKQNPLLYNVFGCIESEESLVLTHNDLYDYFKSIFARKSMPQLLKDQLQEVKYILFLGVPFDKWYMQLVLRELEIHRQEYDFIRHAVNQTLSDEIRTLCVEQFKINFISENQIINFISELNQRCRDAKPPLIRQAGAAERSAGEKIRQFVASADAEAAINLLEDATEGAELQDEVAQLAGRYRMFQRRAISGLLRAEEQEVQQNNIFEAILKLANQL